MENLKCLFCPGYVSKDHLARCSRFRKLRDLRSDEIVVPEFICTDFEKFEKFAVLVKVL